MKMLAEEIAQACGGRIIEGDSEREVISVTTDSRKVGPGALLVPIVGERVDAHRSLPGTAEVGATAVLTQQPGEQRPGGAYAWIAVENTRAALQQIAGVYRFRFPTLVVGMTSSVGKTTTKEMLALTLSAKRNVMKTEGNLNNQLGVSSTMLRLLPEHEAAATEMGTSEFGEMVRLAQAARPTCAVMTNTGASHIENLKMQKNTRAEKLHIMDAFMEDSVLFFSGNDPLLVQLRGTLPFHIAFFGTQPWCDMHAEKIVSFGGTTDFTAVSQEFRISVILPAPGEHNVLNTLVSLTVVQYLGVSPQKMAERLQTYSPPAMCQQIHQVGGITVINDSYNASPDLMRSSVSILMDLKGTGRATGVFVNMLELGDYSCQAHFDVGVYAASRGIDALFVIGEQAQETRWGALSAECHLLVFSHLSNEQAPKELLKYLRPGGVVIVKGSCGMRTDETVRGLLTNEGKAVPTAMV